MKSLVIKPKSWLYDKVSKEFDLFRSRDIDTESIKTVCLALGPYRNLTTLTASILFLHPNCQVLNHAGQRIYNDNRLDFIKKYNHKRFQTFIRYAIYISQKGARGDYGGSITYSHAFDDQYKMKNLFANSGVGLLKENITALFWKESLITSNHIRHNDVDLGKLFAQNKELKFLLPIRNPLDCAVSNLKTGHANRFHDRHKISGVEDVLISIMNEFLWFKNLESHSPQRFFYYFEHDLNRKTLERLAKFLQLNATDDWLTNAVKACEINPGYSHSTSLLSFFRTSVEKKFADYPGFADGLLRFVQVPQETQDQG